MYYSMTIPERLLEVVFEETLSSGIVHSNEPLVRNVCLLGWPPWENISALLACTTNQNYVVRSTWSSKLQLIIGHVMRTWDPILRPPPKKDKWISFYMVHAKCNFVIDQLMTRQFGFRNPPLQWSPINAIPWLVQKTNRRRCNHITMVLFNGIRKNRNMFDSTHVSVIRIHPRLFFFTNSDNMLQSREKIHDIVEKAGSHQLILMWLGFSQQRIRVKDQGTVRLCCSSQR